MFYDITDPENKCEIIVSRVVTVQTERCARRMDFERKVDPPGGAQALHHGGNVGAQEGVVKSTASARIHYRFSPQSASRTTNHRER
jgi:hypothetical protein